MLKMKVKEVIQLCEGSGNNVKEYGQLSEVILAEK
jgi:hypothetical protein